MSPAPVHIHTHGRAAGVCILSRLPELLFPNFAVAEKPPVTAHLPKFMGFFQYSSVFAACLLHRNATTNPRHKGKYQIPQLGSPEA